MSERFTTSFTVPADHPALPGHFPGTPVVPGVVVLDQVIQAAERTAPSSGLSITGLRQVKFHRPLLPQETAQVALDEQAPGTLRFTVKRGEDLIAQGVFATGATAS